MSTDLICWHFFISSATKTAALIQHIFWLHRFLAVIVSDRGPQFTSEVWRSFYAAFSVSLLSSSHPPTPRTNQDRKSNPLERPLVCCSAQPRLLELLELPWVEYAHNSFISASSGMSPFMVSLGYQTPLFDYQGRGSGLLGVGEPVPLQGCLETSLC